MQQSKKNNNNQTLKMYDYYISIDWSIEGAVMAYMRSSDLEPKVKDKIPVDIRSIKENLKELKGSKILTIEETTGSQWLYVELKDSVDKIIICNPMRNRLLEEGSKTDKIDSKKLCQLLRSGLIKEVYHTDNEKYKIRKLVSAYEDLIKAEVRLKNQISAFYRAIGIKSKRGKADYDNSDETLNYIIGQKVRTLELLLEEQESFKELFKQLIKKEKTLQKIVRISGFGPILAVQAYGIVIEAGRFKDKYKFWAYCGLVKRKRESGNISYNTRSKLYSRSLKSKFKMATKAALSGKNDIREYYEYMLKAGYAQKDAWNAVTRYLAKSFYAIMKNGTNYKPYSWRKEPGSKAA